MNAHSSQQQISVDEWREMERNSYDVKHEYIDGRVYAMSGGSLNHSRISLNACFALENALLTASKQCYVYNSDAATRLSSKRYTYPDASVTCNEQDQPTGKKERRDGKPLVPLFTKRLNLSPRCADGLSYRQVCTTALDSRDAYHVLRRSRGLAAFYRWDQSYHRQ